MRMEAIPFLRSLRDNNVPAWQRQQALRFAGPAPVWRAGIQRADRPRTPRMPSNLDGGFIKAANHESRQIRI